MGQIAERVLREMKSAEEYLERSSRCLKEKDSDFTPAEAMFTAAQQVAHIAQTGDWFREGIFGKGFDMDFEAHVEATKKVKSLSQARAWTKKSFAEIAEAIGSKSDEELETKIPPGPIMGGAPRFAVVAAIVEHTAHHRGALSVYSRLCGYVPSNPYLDP